MSTVSSTQKWPGPIKESKGFFEIPYQVNSPQLMIEQLKKLPFVKFRQSDQSISSKTPFLNNTTYYRNISDELFIIYSEMTFKANICFRYQYNRLASSNHYCLSLRVDAYAKNINSLANGVAYSDHSWLLFKPGAKVNHHHFKGTRGRYISIYFTKEWLQKNIINLNRNGSKELTAFIRSERASLICPNLSGTGLFSVESLSPLFKSDDMHDLKYPTKLQKNISAIINFFNAKMQSEGINENHFLVSNLDRIKVLQVEHFLRGCTHHKFPGISHLAKNAGLSETRLKACFLLIYNKTLLQYFNALQMQKAREMILTTGLSIGEVANSFSYENTSKFASAFRRHHGELPSSVRS